MKITNRKILEDMNTLKAVSQKQFPVKVSYAIAKNISKIDSELKIYEKERQKLIEQYSERDEGNKIISDESGNVKFADVDGWNKDIKELLDIENEIEIHKFKFEELGNLNISAEELRVIDYMIEE
ncbi:DUF1617 family protein [Clostridium sp.]|uniref:DUF1617 family protein n=1 Tax=Clostridium sp. TaxID=1506 RepID=UPI0026199FE3|nr:DUF1617 family protein [Clostridium sp.]